MFWLVRYRRSKLDSLLLLRREAVGRLFDGAHALHAVALAVDGIVAAQILRAERVGEAALQVGRAGEQVRLGGKVWKI